MARLTRGSGRFAQDSYEAQKEFHTKAFFNEEIDTISKAYKGNISEKSLQNAQEIARNSGFYFEALFYTQICKLLGETNPRLSGTQLRGVAFFNKISTSPDSESAVKAQDLKKTIEQGAFEGGKYFAENVSKIIGKADNKTIRIINPFGTGPEGRINPDKSIAKEVGDFVVQIGKQHFIVELKAQENPSTLTRWFGLVEGTLFGSKGGFKEFIRDNHEKYWANKKITEEWTHDIEINALSTFLDQKFSGNIQKELQFFFKKGKAYKSSLYSGKYVLHTNKIGFTFKNLSTISNAMQKEVTNIRGEQRTYSGNTNVLTYLNLQGETLGYFGLSKYRSALRKNDTSKLVKKKDKTTGKTTFKTKVTKANIGDPVVDIDNESFSYEFYVAQKYLSDFRN